MEASNRIKTGLHRIGLALLLLPTIAGIGAVGFGTYTWVKPVIKPPRFKVAHDTLGKTTVTYNPDRRVIGSKLRAAFGAGNVSDEVIRRVENGFRDVERDRSQLLALATIGLVLLLLGAALYGASWLVGWIIRGFSG
jgi:hypothetical protein